MPRVGSSRQSTAGRAHRRRRSRGRGAGARRRSSRAGGARRVLEARALELRGSGARRRRGRGRSSRRGSGAAARRGRWRSTRPRVGASSPAAWRSSVDLPAPFRPSSTTRSPAATRSDTPARIVGPPVELVPDAVEAQARPPGVWAPSRGGSAGGSRGRVGQQASRASVARACLTPVGGGSRPSAATSAAAGVSSARRRGVGPVEEPAGRRRRRRSARRERDHAVGGGEAALEAMLGEQDRRPPLLVEPAQQPEQLVARDRIELRGRLVEREQPRAAGERGAERDALELAARERACAPIEQRARCRARAPPPRPRALSRRHRTRGSRAGTRARRAAVPITHLRLRVLEERADVARRARPGRCARRSRPQTSAAPSKRPPWKCGTSPHAMPSSVDLPDAESAGEDDELALLDREAHAVERRRSRRPGSGRSARAARGAHRSIPRRWREGRRGEHDEGEATAPVRALASEPWKVG